MRPGPRSRRVVRRSRCPLPRAHRLCVSLKCRAVGLLGGGRVQQQACRAVGARLGAARGTGVAVGQRLDRRPRRARQASATRCQHVYSTIFAFFFLQKG